MLRLLATYFLIFLIFLFGYLPLTVGGQVAVGYSLICMVAYSIGKQAIPGVVRSYPYQNN